MTHSARDLHTARVLEAVMAERQAQYEKWGEQNHPTLSLIQSHERFAILTNAQKRGNAERVKNGTLDWWSILSEEVFEAFAEADPAARRAELIQVAAVAVAMIEHIDRESASAPPMTETHVQPKELVLGDVIERLESEPVEKRLKLGFGEPHSYRGYYEQLAFEPARNVTVGAMLAAARSALGKTFQGWKGGDYVMNEDSSVWLAHLGAVGEPLGGLLLECLLDSEAVLKGTPDA